LAGARRSQPSQCPLWVKSGHLQCKGAYPLYPRKQTRLFRVTRASDGGFQSTVV